MPPKTKTMVTKKNGCVSLSKRSPWKFTKKTILSVVTPPALDGISVVMANVCGGDVSLDLTSDMDMLMSMLVDVSNKVNGLEQATQGQAAPSPIPSAVTLHDSRTTTQQAAPPQDPDLEEAVCRWVEQHLRQIPLLQAATSQEDSSIEEELEDPMVKRTLKSGKDLQGPHLLRKESHDPMR